MAKKDVLKGRSIVNKNIFDTAGKSIDEIKRANPIAEYFKSKGVNLKSTGNGQFMGLCPFHKDTNPSLSVNEVKQVFKCFGCSKSGTVLDAVSYFENVSIGDAIKILQNKPVKTKEINFPEDEDLSEDLRLDLSDLEDNQETDFDLNKITEYYHKKLYENQKTLDYLAKRGLKNSEIYKRFKIGFADGSLLEVLSVKQKEDLKDAGFLNSYGKEFFLNCLIFPIFDDNDNTIGIYARSIDDNAKVKHLYLKGKHKGIFNRKAGRVYDEIILTESIIDCLSLIELGFENVQSVYGINGFTDEHLLTLKDDRVKTVIIAFDKDEAGRKAGEELKDKLIDEGFKVKLITPTKHKDWNEELINGITADEIKELIEESEILKPVESKEGFKVKKDNFKYIFTIADIDYTVTGVKDIFVSNLRINVKAEYQGEWFPDNLDLYSARSRTSFSSNISQKFGVEATRIEKDLLKILEYLEKERDKALTGKEEAEIELTEEERMIGLAFLKSPDLFDQVVKDMEILGYVGEDLNKQLLYICASTRKLDDPISVLIISQSASGKSYLVDTVKMLLPESEVIAITSLSDQALNYIPDGGLLHKFLTLGEAVHSEIIEHQIREMLSGKELTRLVTTKDEKTGQLASKQVKTKVVVASVMSTTNHRINPENASRYFLINADESKEQTRKIHEAQRNKYSLERYYEKKDKIPEVIKKHKSAQRLLRNIIIVNPFAKHLDFPDATMRTRRDNERFLDLIAGVCFLRQYQKEVKKDNDLEFIECDLADYETAYNIMVNGVLSSTMSDLPKSSEELYEALRGLAKELSKERGVNVNEATFTQREIRENTGYGQSWIRENLRQLVDYEYIVLIRGTKRGERGYYRLKEDENINKLNLNMIPKPEDMKKITKTTK